MPFLFFIFCPKAARFLPGMGQGVHFRPKTTSGLIETVSPLVVGKKQIEIRK